MGCAGDISVDGPSSGEELDYRGAFWLATMGGAQALGLEVRALQTVIMRHSDRFLYIPCRIT